MEFVQYLHERFILKLPVVMLKPLSAILKDFFTDAFVIAWLFIFCCAIGYLIMYFVFKYNADVVNAQANDTQENNPAINNTQANNDTFDIKNTAENNERPAKKLNRATQTLTYYKNWGKTLTRRMLLMEEIHVEHAY